MAETLRRIDRLMKTPASHYRPLPSALKFHQSQKRFRYCVGGNRCLGPDTLIDRPDGSAQKVSDIRSAHFVWAWNGNKAVKATAHIPWIKGHEPCYRIWFSNGRFIDCSANHLLLTIDHGYAAVGSLLQFDAFPPLTTSGIDSSIRLQGVPHLKNTASNCKCDCPTDSRFYDAPLPPAEDIDLVSSPLQVDAQTHISCGALSHTDGRESTHAHIPALSPAAPPSNRDALSRNAGQYVESQFCVFCKGEQFADLNNQSNPQFADASIPHLFLKQSIQSANHVPFPSQALISPLGKTERIVAWEEIGVKPIYDFEVPKYHNYITSGVVHHNSSKSHALAQEVFWYATGMHPFREIKLPSTIWYCTITWEMIGMILWEKMQKLLFGLNEHNKLNETPMFPHRVLWHNRAAGRPSTIFIQTPKGESRIIFKAYEQGADSFQGTERDLIANDEQFPEAVYLEQVSRIGPGAECDFAAAMTPIKPQPWLEQRMADPPASWDVFEFPLDDNRISAGGFIPDATIDGLIEEWPEEVQPTRRSGKWGSFLGAVYKTFSRQVHVVKEADEKMFFPEKGLPHPTWRSKNSVDFGGANPFVCLLATRIPHMDDAWYIYDEYYWEPKVRGIRLLRDHAKHILQMNAKWKATVDRAWADHDSQDRHELAAGGVHTLPAKKDVLPGIEAVQTVMKHSATRKPRFFIAARCVNTIRELSTLRWPDGTDSSDPKDVPVKKDDHGADCARYLVYSELGAPTGLLPASDPSNRRQF